MSQELYQSMPEFPVIRQPTALRRERKQPTFSVSQILKLRLMENNLKRTSFFIRTN